MNVVSEIRLLICRESYRGNIEHLIFPHVNKSRDLLNSITNSSEMFYESNHNMLHEI